MSSSNPSTPTSGPDSTRVHQIRQIRDLRLLLWMNAAKTNDELLGGLIENTEVAVEQMSPECLREAFWGLDYSGGDRATAVLRQYLSVVWARYENLWLGMKVVADTLIERSGLSWDTATTVFQKLDYSEPREKIFDLISDGATQLLRKLQEMAPITLIPEPIFAAGFECLILSHLFRPGLAGYDLFLVRRIAHGAKKGESISKEMEESAKRAARRLAAGYFSQPIYQKKMGADPRLQKELRALAHAEGKDVTATLRRLTESSLFLTADLPSPGSFTGLLRVVKKHLDRLVTEDLLNRPHSKSFREEQGASRYPDGAAFENVDEKVAAENPWLSEIHDVGRDQFEELEALITLKEAAVLVELTPRQFEVMAAVMEGRTAKQESERLGIKPGHARQELKRARQKIKRKIDRDDV